MFNGGLDILIIEDDAAIAVLVTAICSHKRWNCVTVSDGLAGIAELRRRSYDAIVLDLMLPRSNGFEVIAFLRAERPQLLKRVVIITAASPKTLEAFDASRVRALLTKPFDMTEFLAALDAAVSVEQ